MPTFVTHETYACSHVSETRHRTFGTDGNVVVETIPVPSLCLACTCQALLNIFFPINRKKGDDARVRAAARSHMRELSGHLQRMLEDTQRFIANRATYEHRELVRHLEKLRRRVLMPADLGEFRTALFDLSLFSEFNNHLVIW
ncbi:hypothetical protein F4818DRAFT_277289 [Hypoxylon cercidicola]|nr:hypothetical protein F4818DRAFT_277289 [Hypoxylon cercidicola]